MAIFLSYWHPGQGREEYVKAIALELEDGCA
jgi:hypothetical protein